MALFLCFAASQVQAVQSTWIGGASGSRGTGGNWLDGTANFGSIIDLEFSHTSLSGTGTRIGGDRTVRRTASNGHWRSTNGYVRFNLNDAITPPHTLPGGPTRDFLRLQAMSN